MALLYTAFCRTRSVVVLLLCQPLDGATEMIFNCAVLYKLCLVIIAIVVGMYFYNLAPISIRLSVKTLYFCTLKVQTVRY